VSPAEALRRLLASPDLSSKEWVYRQYDHMVRTNTIVLPGSDAAVLRVKETRKALAMALDSNARFCRIDPRAGARLVVAEAARNLSASGARPLAVTNCLNFASPERPEVMWAFSETIDGMAEACTAFGTPVTGGNVSFYNETDGKGIYPTPVIGMVGLIDDPRRVTTQWFAAEGDAILLLGENTDELGGSEYWRQLAGVVAGPLPALELAREIAVQEACRAAVMEGLVRSAHDCADGGLAVALAESCFSSYGRAATGAEVALEDTIGEAALLFGEAPSRILVSVDPANLSRVAEIATAKGVACRRIGTVGGDRLRIDVRGTTVVDEPVAGLERAWRGTIAEAMSIGK
jgi:phosphoribosylformylglycinamidine synthase